MRTIALSAFALAGNGFPGQEAFAQPATGSAQRIEVSFPSSVRRDSLTGRVFVVISRKGSPEPVEQASGFSPETLAVVADHLQPGQAAIIDASTVGSPLMSLTDIPPGDYYAQAYARVYVDYHRADGHLLWGLDQWDGQDDADSPGSLRSDVQRVHIGGLGEPVVKLALTKVTPARPAVTDSEWVKNVKIKSYLLSKFWGRPIYLGATVALPQDYAAHPERSYPVIYEPRNHYRRDGPFTFTTDNPPETTEEKSLRESHGVETGYQFYKAWSGPDFPRMIAITLIDPTPFYDFSSVMNSVNNGPYDDAVMQELIPYLETHFRILRQPWARMLVGKSSGGRDAFGMQLHHPDFFGGAWIFYPWAFDYRHYFSFDIYTTRNAFLVDPSETGGFLSTDEWRPTERTFVRTLRSQPATTTRAWMLNEQVSGGDTGVGAELTGSDNALNSPMRDDGYPRMLYDKLTGVIDPEVANAWRSHDLMAFVEDNWTTIGPKLVGKLHFYVGDMDEWFRNYGIHDLQDYLRKAKPDYAGSFTYGPLKGHEWQPMTNAELVRQVADYIVQSAPKGADMTWRER
jgi:S-formylglutathione hydrolase FrmB